MGPASNRCLERRFLKFFNNISYEDLKNMRWCDLIADFLIESIIEYKHKYVIGKKCWGNVLILLDIFYDFMSEEKDPRFPRSNYITQADLERRFKGADLHSLAANAKMLKDTVYSEEYQMGNASTSGIRIGSLNLRGSYLLRMKKKPAC